jgi:1-acyl-sn-glycerol-3-phosphate acyltransferase
MRLGEPSRRRMRTIKLLGAILVLLAGFVAAALFPLLPGAARLAITQVWSRALLAVLGVRFSLEGDIDARPALLVANHVSWLDVLAMSALRPSVFVCKSEIAAWPALGWLLARADTIFLRRGSAIAASQAAQIATERLKAGLSVAVFPEGTSTCGDEVLPFGAALFQAAVDAACPVQPLALNYSSRAAVYAGDTSFGESLLAVAGARDLRVTLSVLPALAAVADRRNAAVRSRDLIAARVRAGTFPANSGHALEASLAAAQGSHQGLV